MMTPELAYQLRAPISQRISSLHAELEALEALELAFDNYLRSVGAPLEQPGQESAPTSPTGSPAPAPSRPTTTAAKPDATAADGTLSPVQSSLVASSCPFECGYTGSERGVVIRLSKKHPIERWTLVDGKVPSKPEAEPEPEPAARKVTYLCGRNCGRSFDTKERLNQHESIGGCQPKATPPPRSLSERAQAHGYIEGMGQ